MKAKLGTKKPVIGIIAGSISDYTTMDAAIAILKSFEVPFECKVVSAHRTPHFMFEYAKSAQNRGLKIIIAGAGGAAHLPGMVSALTPLPVLAVPVKSSALSGLDSLLSIVQMPSGVPTATFAIGEAGAANAALFAIRILALNDKALAQKLKKDILQRAQAAMDSNNKLGSHANGLKP
jgi:5-(carboxyamino)imidazole ribonucleotide mutase